MGYYMGDFYQGDPGFLSALGRIGKSLVGFIPGIGPAAGKVIGAVGSLARHPAARAAGGALLGAGTGVALERAFPPRTSMGPVMPGGRPLLGGQVGPGVAMRGYHMSKPRKCGGVIVPSHLVRNRRMRVTNPKALRRAIRRAHGFARLAKKVLHFTSPRAPRGRAVFRRKRKRAA